MAARRHQKRPRPLQLEGDNGAMPPPGGRRTPDMPGARKRHCSPSMLTPNLSKLSSATANLRTSPGRSYFDLDMIECGVAKEVVAPDKHTPLPRNEGWSYCYVRKVKTADDVGKDVKKFSMYSEADDTFLLSAVHHKGSFYISQHELFPAAFDPARTLNDQEFMGRYIAILRPKKRKGEFELVTFSCENCDARLGKYSCGLVPDPARQKLMTLKHSCPQLVSDPSYFITARQLQIQIPPLFVDGTREVWCPRCPRGSGNGRTRLKTESSSGGGSATPGAGAGAGTGADVGAAAESGGLRSVNSFRSVRTASFTTTASGSFRVAGAGAGAGAGSGSGKPPRPPTSARSVTAAAAAPPPTPPAWVMEAAKRSRSKSPSPEREMRFARPLPDAGSPDCVELRSRLPEWNYDTHSLTMEFSGERIRESSSRNFLVCTNEYEHCLQFGKATSRKFVLDVRHPFSLLQGFGAFLSVFLWKVVPKLPPAVAAAAKK